NRVDDINIATQICAQVVNVTVLGTGLFSCQVSPYSRRGRASPGPERSRTSWSAVAPHRNARRAMLRPDEMIIPEESRGQGPVAEQVPERPALAPDVELIGPMPETGFTDQQWLVRQGNRFLQVTELLYELLQEINGERTLDEIAVNLTGKTEWTVGREHVSRMLQTKLLPLGLLASAPVAVASGSGRRGRSPLQLSLRRNLAGPRVLEPVTT